MKMKTFAIAAAVALLVGCATPTTGVVPLSDGIAKITRQGDGFWVSTDSLKTAAILEADAHCKGMGKPFKLIHSKEIHDYGFRRSCLCRQYRLQNAA